MDLALIRHAIAEDGEDDFARPLSKRGRKRFKAVVAGLERLDLRFERILHSPKLRALETAELLAPLADQLEMTPLLTAAPSVKLLDALRGGQLALVGHEPHLSALLAWLTCGQLEQGPRYELKKGGVALLSGSPSPGGMQLTALLPPALFQRRGA